MSRVIDGVLYLDISIQTEQYLDISVVSDTEPLAFTIEDGGGSLLPYYEGSYIVEPRKVGQSLATANKSMRNDVTINPIFYSAVPNPQGGDTVVIGQE